MSVTVVLCLLAVSFVEIFISWYNPRLPKNHTILLHIASTLFNPGDGNAGMKVVKFSAVCIMRKVPTVLERCKCSDLTQHHQKPGQGIVVLVVLEQHTPHIGPGASSRWLGICSADGHDDNAGGDEDTKDDNTHRSRTPDLMPSLQA